MQPTGEQEVLRPEASSPDPFRNRFSGLLCDLELDGPLGLLLHDDGASGDALTVCYIPDPQPD